MAAPGPFPTSWSRRISTGCVTPWLRAGTCSNAAAPRSMPSKKLWSSWKTTRLLMPVAAASLIAKAKCNSTPPARSVERLRNPVRAARKILSDSPHVYFVAEGAERFAAEHGIALCSNEDLIILREFQARAADAKVDLFAPTISHDTVGAVALDRDGNIAAATSTGGTLNKAPGRLGDSSLIGCGCYADNLSAAVSTTGWGEPIMKLVLAKWAADRVASGSMPQWVAEEAMNYLKDRVNGHGGIILLDSHGRYGLAHNTPRMAWALQTFNGIESGIERT